MNAAADEAPVVLLEDVRFRYPGASVDTLVLDRFAVSEGERVFVRGPSGSGKTTLLSLLAGVLVPTAGRAVLAGHAWRTLSVSARDRLRVAHIGYIFQQFNLLPYLSVLDNVLLPCRFSPERRARVGTGTIAATADELLTRMGLSRALHHRPASRLSVGQQQRVAAARALIGTPRLVIADEPTSALDEDARATFMQLLLGACSAARSALVFVSHDARLAPLFDREVDLAVVNRAADPAAETGA